MITVYGIPNCDTIKKTLDWLKKNKIEYEFHDYKKSGISKEKLSAWSKKVGWEVLLNRKSTTWKSLSPQEQQAVTTQASAIKEMMKNNSIIKRPVIESGDVILVGFNDNEFIKQLK
jgi:arsenate reductase